VKQKRIERTSGRGRPSMHQYEFQKTMKEETILDAPKFAEQLNGAMSTMLGNYEKNNKKILYVLDLKIWRFKRCSFDVIYFKY
jgi:hypothetical protein